MGFFNTTQKEEAKTVYEKAKKNLKPKDGKKHILMINSFSKWLNQGFECESKYTTQIEEIISNMQNDGYEILDIIYN